jgi:hypothetical protein
MRTHTRTHRHLADIRRRPVRLDIDIDRTGQDTDGHRTDIGQRNAMISTSSRFLIFNLIMILNIWMYHVRNILWRQHTKSIKTKKHQNNRLRTIIKSSPIRSSTYK